MSSQYQSFPGAKGDSRTFDKLMALKLPDLEGKTFLDVGCNEGFFCGFAKFAGASRSVGLDRSQLFIDRARLRFPECEFLLSDWDNLPQGRFDVILLASALHYASDQSALVRRLVEHLTPDGVLVLEIGVVSSDVSEWQQVRRGDDERLFASMRKLEEVFAPYAWKWLGPSVNQSGDPVGRHVFHLSPRKPVAYLLMEPPGYGKTTISRSLFEPLGVDTVSGDETLMRVARGKLKAPAGLHAAIADDFSVFRIDEAVHRVFEAGQGDAFIALCADQAGGGDFALDGYVPAECQPLVEDALRRSGYLPVRLTWTRPGSPPLAQEQLEAVSAEFLSHLEDAPALKALPGDHSRGFIDDAQVTADGLLLVGWAVAADGTSPVASLQVELGGVTHVVPAISRARPDVRARLQLAHDDVGFSARIDVDGGNALMQVLRELKVRPRDCDRVLRPLQISQTLRKRVGSGQAGSV